MRRLMLRIDDDLHARLKRRAKLERRSMSALASEILDRKLPPEDRDVELPRRSRSERGRQA